MYSSDYEKSFAFAVVAILALAVYAKSEDSCRIKVILSDNSVVYGDIINEWWTSASYYQLRTDNYSFSMHVYPDAKGSYMNCQSCEMHLLPPCQTES